MCIHISIHIHIHIIIYMYINMYNHVHIFTYIDMSFIYFVFRFSIDDCTLTSLKYQTTVQIAVRTPHGLQKMLITRIPTTMEVHSTGADAILSGWWFHPCKNVINQ